MKVLILESNEKIARAMARTLYQKGHEVALAQTGDALLVESFDLIISDLIKLEGVARKRLDLCPQIPFVVFAPDAYVEPSLLKRLSITKLILRNDPGALLGLIDALDEFQKEIPSQCSN